MLAAHPPFSGFIARQGKEGLVATYCVVDDILSSRIVVDVDCDAAQSCDFCAQLTQAAVVLALPVVCLAIHLGCGALES